MDRFVHTVKTSKLIPVGFAPHIVQAPRPVLFLFVDELNVLLFESIEIWLNSSMSVYIVNNPKDSTLTNRKQDLKIDQ